MPFLLEPPRYQSYLLLIMYIIEHSLWVVLAAENKKNMSFNYVVLFRGSCQNTYIFVFFELILRAVFIPFCNSKIADK